MCVCFFNCIDLCDDEMPVFWMGELLYITTWARLANSRYKSKHEREGKKKKAMVCWQPLEEDK